MTAIAFASLLFAVGVYRIDQHQTNQVLFRAIQARSTHAQVAAYRVLEPSWVFYGGQPIREILDDKRQGPGAAAAAARQFLAADPNHFVITTADKFREFSATLPLGIGVIEQTPYFLHSRQKLVLIGPLVTPQSAARSPPAPPFSRNDLR